MIKYISSFLLFAIFMINNCESAPRYQFLPPREGYVPVYIRLGDQPLEEIHPGLALAFHHHNVQSEDKISNLITPNDDNELKSRLRRSIAKLNEESQQTESRDEIKQIFDDGLLVLQENVEKKELDEIRKKKNSSEQINDDSVENKNSKEINKINKPILENKSDSNEYTSNEFNSSSSNGKNDY